MGEMAEMELNSAELFDDASDETLEMAKFLSRIPERDPLAEIHNMRRNLGRALGIARDGSVYLTEAEVKYWIEGIDRFLQDFASRDLAHREEV